MNAYIVTEGEADRVLLSRLLAEEVREGARIGWASNRSGAQSLARSLVAAHKRAVALVLDADTTDEALVREQRLVTREYLAMASPGVPTEVFMAVPCIEVLFFADREMLTRLVGVYPSDHLWETGQFDPKNALDELRKDVHSRASSVLDLVSVLTDEDAALMSRHPPIRELKAFLRELAPARTATG
jgi:hypothetical protein